jgi:nicotinamidase-related amidase
MNTLSHDTALLLIDVQQAFNDPGWGRRNNPEAEQRIGELLAAWRASGRPVIHIQHRRERPASRFYVDGPGFPFKPEALPRAGETILHKDVNSAFIGTGLEQHLHEAGIRALVIAGLTTDHCVSTTTRMAGNLGFDTIIVGDACATFERTGPDGTYYSAQLMHDVALASLHGEFATVLATREVLTLT